MAKKNLFTQVEFTKIKSNRFDLSHDVKLSLKMGKLYPIMCTEAIPGDRLTLGCESLLRFAPLVAPVMHRMDVTMHYFFCPNRLIWANWENYITNTKVGGVLPAFPTINLSGGSPTTGSLLDYMGIPELVGMAGTLSVSALPFAAYQAIYNEYYRDQNLITEIDYVARDGNNAHNATFNAIRIRAWEHDYFTACLPTPQKAGGVDLPILGFDDVAVLANEPPDTPGDSATVLTGTGVPSAAADNKTVPYGTPQGGVTTDLYAETSQMQTTSTNISDLRRAFKLQEWLEKAMRGGSRYIEFIRSMFGVQSSDKRLQRPEYITGVKSPVVISEVLNTTGTASAPQGEMAGHGVSVTSGKYGSYYAEEHGYIIGIMSVLPKTAYQQGLPKHFTKINDPFEFYFEQFAHIGEQAVLNKEIYVHNTAIAREETFGYIPRYAEYKFENNRVAGDFRSTLDFWHLARQFGSAPALNQTFIECVPDTRIFAVEDGTDYLWAHVYNKVSASRKMPFFGSPKF